jgi:hypothetical protein
MPGFIGFLHDKNRFTCCQGTLAMRIMHFDSFFLGSSGLFRALSGLCTSQKLTKNGAFWPLAPDFLTSCAWWSPHWLDF